MTPVKWSFDLRGLMTHRLRTIVLSRRPWDSYQKAGAVRSTSRDVVGSEQVQPDTHIDPGLWILLSSPIKVAGAASFRNALNLNQQSQFFCLIPSYSQDWGVGASGSSPQSLTHISNILFICFAERRLTLVP